MIRVATYSKRKFFYEFLDALGILSFLSIIILVIGQKTKNEFIEKNIMIFVFLFFLGFVWVLIRFFIGKMKWYKPIKINGEIDFYSDYLIYKTNRIQLEKIKTIRISLTQCKGQPIGGRAGLSDGTGNYIEIFLKNKSKLKEKMLIENKEQVTELMSLMENWKKSEIKFIGEWKPFLHIFDS
jgi:hypothetical protein